MLNIEFISHFLCAEDFLTPLRAKLEGEFIEIRHKKMSLTHILSTLG